MDQVVNEEICEAISVATKMIEGKSIPTMCASFWKVQNEVLNLLFTFCSSYISSYSYGYSSSIYNIYIRFFVFGRNYSICTIHTRIIWYTGGCSKANRCWIKLKYICIIQGLRGLINHCLNELIDLNRWYDTIIKSHSKNNDQRVHRIPNWGNKSID